MSTSRNNYKFFESPYAKSLSQYPSQSEEFIPLEMGGSGTNVPRNRQTPNKNYHCTSTPAKCGRGSNTLFRFSPTGGSGYLYQDRQQNRGTVNNHRNRNYGGRQSGGSDNNMDGNRRSFDNSQYQSPRYNSFNASSDYGSRCGNFHKNNKKDFGSYFHPSMLEDPWRELMQRHNAIRNSKINISTEQENEQQSDIKKDFLTESLNKMDKELNYPN